MSRRHEQRGFSLLEVLVAFAVLALVLGALFQVFSRGLRTATLSSEYAGALVRVQSLVDGVAAREEIEAGTSSGDYEDGPYRWHLTVEPYDWGEPAAMEQVPLQAFRVMARVSWEEAGQSRQVDLTTIKLAPRQ